MKLLDMSNFSWPYLQTLPVDPVHFPFFLSLSCSTILKCSQVHLSWAAVGWMPSCSPLLLLSLPPAPARSGQWSLLPNPVSLSISFTFLSTNIFGWLIFFLSALQYISFLSYLYAIPLPDSHCPSTFSSFLLPFNWSTKFLTGLYLIRYCCSSACI